MRIAGPGRGLFASRAWSRLRMLLKRGKARPQKLTGFGPSPLPLSHPMGEGVACPPFNFRLRIGDWGFDTSPQPSPLGAEREESATPGSPSVMDATIPAMSPPFMPLARWQRKRMLRSLPASGDGPLIHPSALGPCGPASRRRHALFPPAVPGVTRVSTASVPVEDAPAWRFRTADASEVAREIFLELFCLVH